MKRTKNQAIVIVGFTIMYLLVCALSYTAGVVVHQVAHVF